LATVGASVVIVSCEVTGPLVGVRVAGEKVHVASAGSPLQLNVVVWL
jgi:hypothetical protein